jgi:hypothetical protein
VNSVSGWQRSDAGASLNYVINSRTLYSDWAKKSYLAGDSQFLLQHKDLNALTLNTEQLANWFRSNNTDGNISETKIFFRLVWKKGGYFYL